MIRVIVNPYFPYKSTDPDRPGTVHGVTHDGIMYCSQECYDRLKALPGSIEVQRTALGPIPIGVS